MWHRRFNRNGEQISGCGGRIFVDRAFSSESLVEIACVECGWRKMIDPAKNALARLLVRAERKFVNAGL